MAIILHVHIIIHSLSLETLLSLKKNSLDKSSSSGVRRLVRRRLVFSFLVLLRSIHGGSSDLVTVGGSGGTTKLVEE
ncbi:hypothetical protein Bca4012_085164 [Brassica carinata]